MLYVVTEALVLKLKEQVGENEARIEELRQENQRLHDLLRQMASGRTESDRQQP